MTMNNGQRSGRAGAILLMIGACLASPLSGSASAQAKFKSFQEVQEENTPPLELSESPVQMGYLLPESVLERTIFVTNIGEDQVFINRITSACSCTVAAPSKRNLEPGDKVPLQVRLEARALICQMSEEIRIFCDGFKLPLTFRVNAEVGYPVQVNPGGVKAILSQIGFVELAHRSNVPFRVVSVNGDAPDLVGFDPEQDEPRTRYLLRHDYSKSSVDELPRWMLIETDAPGSEMIDVRLLVDGIGDVWSDKSRWHPADKRVMFRRIPEGRVSDYEIKFVGLMPAEAERLELESTDPNLGIRITGARRIEDGVGSWVTLEFDPGDYSGYVESLLTFRLQRDDGTEEMSQLDLFGRVKPEIDVEALREGRGDAARGVDGGEQSKPQ